MPGRLHDQKCYDLAEYFLGDGASDERKSDLAQHIQDEVENWLGLNTTKEADPDE